MILTYTLLKNGLPYDATSVSLPNGITRTDTNGVVVAAGANPYTRIGVGVYQFTFNEPSPGLTYSFLRQVVVDGQTISETITKTATTNTPTAAYWNWTGFVNRWGLKNIATASNKDNTSSQPNYACVQDSFDYAVDEINDTLRGGVLKVPLDFSPWGGTIPNPISRAGQVIAFADLYDVRGWLDKNPVGNKLSRLLRETYASLSAIKTGLRQIDAVPNVDSNSKTVMQGGCPTFDWVDLFGAYGLGYAGLWGRSMRVSDGVLTWYGALFNAA